ncbi:MAG: hypothetical protein LBU14_05555 [Candidatus Peribacteria bacterium]|nr:hypothetical protein [Candidatus Peribacteria bacterium]
MYTKFSTYIEHKSIFNTEFKVSNLELSLVEACVLNDINENLDISLLTKTLKKYRSVLNNSIFYEIAKYKYIMSFNRLKTLTK